MYYLAPFIDHVVCPGTDFFSNVPEMFSISPYTLFHNNGIFLSYLWNNLHTKLLFEQTEWINESNSCINDGESMQSSSGFTSRKLDEEEINILS